MNNESLKNSNQSPQQLIRQLWVALRRLELLSVELQQDYRRVQDMLRRFGRPSASDYDKIDQYDEMLGGRESGEDSRNRDDEINITDESESWQLVLVAYRRSLTKWWESWNTAKESLADLPVEFFDDQSKPIADRWSPHVWDWLMRQRSWMVGVWFDLEARMPWSREEPEMVVAVEAAETQRMEQCDWLDDDQFERIRNKLMAVWEYLEHSRDAEHQPAPSSDGKSREILPELETEMPTVMRVANAYTGGVADAKIQEIAQVVDSDRTVNEKLRAMHHIIAIPANLSARALGELLHVSGTAVRKTEWWQKNRYGLRQKNQKEYENKLRERGAEYMPRRDEG